MPPLRDFLTNGDVRIADGAMGTMLYERGVFVNVCYDELALRQPGFAALSVTGGDGMPASGNYVVHGPLGVDGEALSSTSPDVGQVSAAHARASPSG